MHAIILCTLISVAPPPAPTFDEVILVPGETGQDSYLYLVITQDGANADRLAKIVVQYAAAALLEAKRLKFRDFPGQPVVPGEDFKYEGNVVLCVRDLPHERDAAITGFMPRQLRTIATAKPDVAKARWPTHVGAVEVAVSEIVLRTTLKPGDVGTVIQLHGLIHAELCGFDPTFEAYVAGPLAEFVKAASPRGRLWLAERERRVVGCIAIVEADEKTAQLRWFLVVAQERGAGLGKRLLNESLAFCREQSYETVILWTVSSLEAAARLYRTAGFVKVEEKPGRMWGVDVVEEKYEFRLR